MILCWIMINNKITSTVILKRIGQQWPVRRSLSYRVCVVIYKLKAFCGNFGKSLNQYIFCTLHLIQRMLFLSLFTARCWLGDVCCWWMWNRLTFNAGNKVLFSFARRRDSYLKLTKHGCIMSLQFLIGKLKPLPRKHDVSWVLVRCKEAHWVNCTRHWTRPVQQKTAMEIPWRCVTMNLRLN